MTDKNVWQEYIEGDDGLIVPSATVTVTLESTAALASLYTSETGGVSKANPFTSDADGLAKFYVAAGIYRIDVVSGGFSASYRHVAIGGAAGVDVGTAGGEISTNTANLLLFVPLDSSPELLLDIEYDGSQSPVSVDTPLNVNWCATDQTATGVLVKGFSASAADRGKITFSADGTYLLEKKYNVYVAPTAASDAVTYVSKLINGAYDSIDLSRFYGAAATGYSYQDTVCISEVVVITGAPKTILFTMTNDSQGGNNASLFPFLPVLTGVPNQPSASLKIWKIL